MKRAEAALLTAAIMVAAGAVADAADRTPAREFTATAQMTTRQGSRSMPVTLIASKYTSLEDAQALKDILASGGQSALLASLRGRVDGRLRLGALELPISLALAEASGDEYRYVFVTGRRIQVEEINEGSDSLDYPFGVAVFSLGAFGRGQGEIYPAAALRIGEGGSVEVEQFEAAPGRLTSITRVR